MIKKIKTILFSFVLLSCSTTKPVVEESVKISSNPETINTQLEIEFLKGKSHNQPSFAFWIEDLEGNYIETIFVTKSVASGVFRRGEIEPGKWKNEPGNVRRPASLPYWSHKRNIQAKDGLFIPDSETTVPDAISGATPQHNFVLNSGTKINKNTAFRILFEINQPWDSNDFWSNDKFPGDNNYATSLQPALVYAATIDASSETKNFAFKLIGHSHPSGETGELFSDINTITSAKNIVQKITVNLK